MVLKRDIIIGLALLIGGLLFLMIVLSIISGTKGLTLFPKGGKQIALVEILGPIDDTSSRDIVRQIKRYTESNQFPAIVLRINSPGGGIVAAQEIYEQILKARERNKVVVASMGSIAASGGYYIACAADTIVANPGTLTGSIGVIAFFPNVEKIMETVGLKFNILKSGKFKDSGSIFREMEPEEREMIESLIMDSYDQFLEAITQTRNMDKNELISYADGRVFTGRQAQRFGLVDVLGTCEDAKIIAAQMANLSPDTPVFEERRKDYIERLFGIVFSNIIKHSDLSQNNFLRLGYLYIP